MNPIGKLLQMSELEYVYHMNILHTLDFCVRNNVYCKTIDGVEHKGNRFNLFLTKGDWLLAFSLCENFFKQNPDDYDKLKMISELREIYYEKYT